MASDLEREIEETREHLADTVDALGAKLDVKSRAQESFAGADKRRLAAAAGVLLAGLVVAVVVWPREG